MVDTTATQAQTAPASKRSRFRFLKKKRYWVILILLLLAAGWYYQSSKNAGIIEYELFEAEQRDLVQSVEVTGEIKPAARIDLAFETNGTLEQILVKIGDDVKKGDVLAKLEGDDLNFAYRRAEAAYAIASASLNQRLAGETDESIQVAQSGVDQAQASYDKALSDLENTKIQVDNDLKNAKIALETAKNNLDNASPISDQALVNAIESSRASLLGALGPLQTALIDGDTVSGVDDTATNQLYEKYLGILSDGSKQQSEQSYQIAKASKKTAEELVNAITSDSSQADVIAAADVLLIAINDVQQYLLDVQTVLSNTITSTYFNQTQLEAKKNVITADYSAVTGQKTTVNTARQTVLNATLSKTSEQTRLEDAYRTAQVAYDIALTNIDLKISTASSSVAIQKAALDAAKATLALKKSDPRAVDLAGLRAQVQDAKVALDQAAANLKKAQVIAPVDGTITDVVSDIGEQVVANTAQVKMIGTEKYDIEAQVPEADITKVKVAQTALITLDAYGDEIEFEGTVTAENPDQTAIQDAIYYDVRVQIDQRGMEIKPGMTANVTITTEKVPNAIIIPLRAIRTDAETGVKTIRVLVNDQPVERTIVLGTKGDEGRVQVVEGVSKGDMVILREITK
ncbi:MAG: efflux RND transporter periplasmic adaptor subunit [Patescibacteria group bacterium]|nr:efflux RND transporter periplasmic adaptor subunit [Patescibacteria group bacterium]